MTKLVSFNHLFFLGQELNPQLSTFIAEQFVIGVIRNGVQISRRIRFGVKTGSLECQF